MQLKVRQQAKRIALVKRKAKNLLANQKVSFKHHIHLGATYINVTLIVPDGSLRCSKIRKQKMDVDVLSSGNNIAETINTNINPVKTTDDGE